MKRKASDITKVLGKAREMQRALDQAQRGVLQVRLVVELWSAENTLRLLGGPAELADSIAAYRQELMHQVGVVVPKSK